MILTEGPCREGLRDGGLLFLGLMWSVAEQTTNGGSADKAAVL